MRSLIAILLGSLMITTVAPASPPLPPFSNVVSHFEAKHGGHQGSLDIDSTHSYDMKYLRLDYQVENTWTPLTGWAYLTITGRTGQSQIVLDVASELTVQSVTANGAAVTFSRTPDTLFVSRALGPGETVTLGFQIASAPMATRDVGYHVETDHAYTFTEPWGARKIFPCFDQPFDKLDSVEVAVNMPENWWLASNGQLVETSYPSTGRKRQVYRLPLPIPTYLVMLAAGDYARQYHNENGVEYRYFTFHRDSAAVVYDWARTPLMVQTFADMFGPYPYQQYGMVQANIMDGWGAMEHTTFTTWGAHLIDGVRTYEPVVAHELAHQWFGDYLTCADFRNIWLNEGFASYCGELFYQRIDGQQRFEEMLANDANTYYIEDRYLRYTMYDPPAQAAFGHVEYEKGAWVLHMLREQLLGDSLFFRLMRQYVAAHPNGTVNTEDFIGSVNAVSGQDLHWFFQQWVYEAGHPEVQYWIQSGVPTASDVTVTIQQIQQNAPIFRFPLTLDVVTQAGTSTRFFWFNQQSQTVVEHFASAVISADLVAFQPLLAQLIPLDAPPINPPVVHDFALGSVYPNPFNASARIPFELANDAKVKIAIFDITGRCVATLADGQFAAGKHELHYEPDETTASGVYFVSMAAGNRHFLTKAVLLK
jgi:aminopeptidase N